MVFPEKNSIWFGSRLTDRESGTRKSRLSIARSTHATREEDGSFPLPESFRFLINEEIAKWGNALLIGPPGSGKTVFCENLVRHCLLNDMSCIYVTVDQMPDAIRRDLERHGTDVNGSLADRVVFVDAYSWLIGKSLEKFHIDNLSNLTELNFRIVSAASSLPKPFLLLFDSISPLSLYNTDTFVTKFLQLLLARIKDYRSMGIYVVQDGVHSQEFYSTLSYLVDAIFDMKVVEEKGRLRRYFRIRSISSAAHDTRWIPFTIEEGRTMRSQFVRGNGVES